jgi:hypothetical protein
MNGFFAVRNFSLLEFNITPSSNVSEYPMYFDMPFIYNDDISAESVFIKI